MPITFKTLLFSSICSLGFADFDDFFETDYALDNTIAEVKTAQPQAKKTASFSKESHNHFFIEAEAMILSSGVNNLEFGDRVFSDTKIQEHHLSSLPRPYNVGVRGAIGAELGGIGWDIKASAFHYSNTAKKTLNAAGNNAYEIYLTYSSDLNKAVAVAEPGGKQQGKYKINLNIADLLMTKSLVSQKHFDFVLDSGFRFLNVHQRLNINNNTTNPSLLFLGNTTIKNSDKLNSYGLLARIHNMFKFTKTFSLDLSGCFSLVYGQEKMTNLADANPPFDPFASYFGSSFKQYDKKLLPIVELEAKFQYEDSFYDDAFRLGISAGYFMMNLINGFNGIKMAYSANPLSVQTTSRFQADTVLQGVTCGLHLRF